MSEPRKPTGNSDEARFQRFVHERVTRESNLGRVAGQKVMNTTLGKVIVPRAGGSGGSGASVQMFKLRLVEDDYLVCREWDGTTIGTADVFVAKPPLLRCSVASRTVYEVEHEYTYADDTDEPFMEYGTTVPGSDPEVNEWGESATDYDSGGDLYQVRLNQIRTVLADGIQEAQRVVPYWVKGDVIFGIECDDTDVANAEYLMISEARMWART